MSVAGRMVVVLGAVLMAATRLTSSQHHENAGCHGRTWLLMHKERLHESGNLCRDARMSFLFSQCDHATAPPAFMHSPIHEVLRPRVKNTCCPRWRVRCNGKPPAVVAVRMLTRKDSEFEGTETWTLVQIKKMIQGSGGVMTISALEEDWMNAFPSHDLSKYASERNKSLTEWISGNKDIGVDYQNGEDADGSDEADHEHTSIYLRRFNLPSNMSEYKNLHALVSDLIGLLESSNVEPNIVGCVSAMSHLKRLQHQMGKKRSMQTRYVDLYSHLLEIVEPSLFKLKFKHIAMLMNSLVYQDWLDQERLPRMIEVIELCMKRLQKILSHVIPGTQYEVVDEEMKDWQWSNLLSEDGYNQRTVAILINAMAKLKLKDELVLSKVARIILGKCMPPGMSQQSAVRSQDGDKDWDKVDVVVGSREKIARFQTLMIRGQITGRSLNIALFLNGYARLNYFPPDLFSGMTTAILEMGEEGFQGSSGAKDVSNILNAFARHGSCDNQLLQLFSVVLRRLEAQGVEFSSQSIGNIANAFVRLGYSDDSLSPTIGKVLLAIPPDDLDTQAISILTNFFANQQTLQPEVLRCLEFAVLQTQLDEWTGQSVGITLNALQRISSPNIIVLSHLLDACLQLDDSEYDSQAISNVVHAFAKVHFAKVIDCSILFERMGQDESRSARVVLNRLLQVVESMPKGGFNLQGIAMILRSVHAGDVERKEERYSYYFQLVKGMSPAKMSSQGPRSISEMFEVLEKLNWQDQSLLLLLSQRAIETEEYAWMPTWVVAVLSAARHFGLIRTQPLLFAHLARAVQHIKPTRPFHQDPPTIHEFSIRDLAALADVYSDPMIFDESIFWHVAAIAQQFPERYWDASSLTTCLKSFYKTGQNDMFMYKYFARAALSLSKPSNSLFLLLRLAVTACCPPDLPGSDAAAMLDIFSNLKIQDATLYAHLLDAVGREGEAFVFTAPMSSESRQWLSSGFNDTLARELARIKLPEDQLWTPDMNAEVSIDFDALEERGDTLKE
ncbi:hypothetical protein GUITHDRAFT_148607 [Guillardia theta CCMP2712]|uniref:Uncharacterized protein n=2 Tax=Guillardia theta TaxID=55529 RepID=L1I8P9_GUITC|nr:hypothetical protein GUITHDRAFT_148607 [Guillardia theta CCMP2712]EKX32462.1 hypothetical protein GUITHDRAFT_148607 [Guillardia theta CCMP2712]|eukprot:XP_005819442.1 hypothetical protein GUITHDRAFT_148607 [Guillardia theta CCMP2712]